LYKNHVNVRKNIYLNEKRVLVD